MRLRYLSIQKWESWPDCEPLRKHRWICLKKKRKKRSRDSTALTLTRRDSLPSTIWGVDLRYNIRYLLHLTRMASLASKITKWPTFVAGEGWEDWRTSVARDFERNRSEQKWPSRPNGILAGIYRSGGSTTSCYSHTEKFLCITGIQWFKAWDCHSEPFRQIHGRRRYYFVS